MEEGGTPLKEVKIYCFYYIKPKVVGGAHVK